MEVAEYDGMFTVENTHWWFVSRRVFVEKTLHTLGMQKGTKLRIADIGAGTGGMVQLLEQYGSVVGVEPKDRGRSLAKKRGILLQKGRAEITGLPNNSFDLVCFFDVLYHKNIHEDKALVEAWRILKSKGLLVITDAAMPWLYSRNDRAVHGARRYTISSIKSAITRAGFMPIRATYIFFLVFPIFVFWRLFQRFFGKKTRSNRSDVRPVPVILNTILKFVSVVEAQFLPVVFYPWGSSILVVGQKS